MGRTQQLVALPLVLLQEAPEMIMSVYWPNRSPIWYMT